MQKEYHMKFIKKIAPINYSERGLYLCEQCNNTLEVYCGGQEEEAVCRQCYCKNIKEAKRQGSLYSRWMGIRSRCKNVKRPDYHGKGISVSTEWNDFLAFKKWSLSNGYKENLQIDRIDNDGNYEPSNCRWTTPSINSLNRSTSIANRFTEEELSDMAELYCNTPISLRKMAIHTGISLPTISKLLRSYDLETKRKIS